MLQSTWVTSGLESSMWLLFAVGGSRAAACTLFTATDVEVAVVVEDKSKHKQGENITQSTLTQQAILGLRNKG